MEVALLNSYYICLRNVTNISKIVKTYISFTTILLICLTNRIMSAMHFVTQAHTSERMF